MTDYRTDNSYNDALHNVYLSLNIVTMTKTKNSGLTGHVARMIINSQLGRRVARPTIRWEDNIKTRFKLICPTNMNCLWFAFVECIDAVSY